MQVDILHLYQQARQQSLSPQEVEWLESQLEQFPYFSLPHTILARQSARSDAPQKNRRLLSGAAFSANRLLFQQYMLSEGLVAKTGAEEKPVVEKKASEPTPKKEEAKEKPAVEAKQETTEPTTTETNPQPVPQAKAANKEESKPQTEAKTLSDAGEGGKKETPPANPLGPAVGKTNWYLQTQLKIKTGRHKGKLEEIRSAIKVPAEPAKEAKASPALQKEAEAKAQPAKEAAPAKKAEAKPEPPKEVAANKKTEAKSTRAKKDTSGDKVEAKTSSPKEAAPNKETEAKTASTKEAAPVKKVEAKSEPAKQALEKKTAPVESKKAAEQVNGAVKKGETPKKVAPNSVPTEKTAATSKPAETSPAAGSKDTVEDSYRIGAFSNFTFLDEVESEDSSEIDTALPREYVALSAPISPEIPFNELIIEDKDRRLEILVTPEQLEEYFQGKLPQPAKSEAKSGLEFDFRPIDLSITTDDLDEKILDEKVRPAAPSVSAANRTGELISKFIEEEPTITRQPSGKAPKVDLSKDSTQEDDEWITETLGIIHAMQGNTSKAIEIYRKLALKFPAKKAYFDDLIQKLKK